MMLKIMNRSRFSLTQKRALLMVADLLSVNFAYLLTLFFYFEGQNPFYSAKQLVIRAVVITVVHLVLFIAFGLYNSIWHFAGMYELAQCFAAVSIGQVLCLIYDYVVWTLWMPGKDFVWGYYLFIWMLTFACVGGMRVLYRVLRRFSSRSLRNRRNGNRIMIIGAGEMGNIILNELKADEYRKGVPVVIVDDSIGKQGRRMHGVPVRGGCDKIPEISARYNVDTIIYCIPSASEERQREILEIAMKTGCQLKKSPTMQELVSANGAVKKIRDVEIADLLARPEIKLDTEVCSYLKDQVVLITGGGGSIGSELCRQAALYAPKKIVLFDIYENNVFELRNDMNSIYHGNPEIVIRIGSVRDMKRLQDVFEEFHPSVVFHAAAHKHVPLMEDSPCEAVKNNVFGTFNAAACAEQFGVKKFVILSTDKAVNPTNVMGATKRITELIVQYFNRYSSTTHFAAVRFGNVLGSNGSVIPIFKKQIAKGGPVTVTDARMTRYFMTIPEAAQLVVQAGGLAKGGEVFVLDMGQPVKILSLAEQLIRLSGFEPYRDIDIVFSGLRPGEKLYEELSMDQENADRQMTSNNKIFVTTPFRQDDVEFLQQLEDLKHADAENVRDCLRAILPNYVDNEVVNSKVKG